VGHEADSPPEASLFPKGVQAHDLEPARRRTRGCGEDAEQRRLARAVLAQNRHMLASVDREVD
jgi:hypothetical protein